MDGGRVSTLRKKPGMSTGPDQSAELKFVVTNTLIVGDIQRSVVFYRGILGAKVLREGEPTFLRLGNIWTSSQPAKAASLLPALSSELA
jgi:hypothetical protein